MPYGFSKSIRNRYRKLWAKKQIGKGIEKSVEKLTSRREPVPITKKRKRKSKNSLKRKKR